MKTMTRSLFQTKVSVKPFERVLLYHKDRLVRILKGGEHTFWGSQYSIETFNINQPLFKHALQDYLISERTDLVREFFEVVSTSEQQVAVVRRNQDLLDVVLPRAVQLYWKGFTPLDIELLDVKGGVKLPADHILLTQKYNSVLTRVFTDVNTGDRQFALVERAGRLADLVLPGERRLYLHEALKTTVTYQALRQSLDQNTQDVVRTSHADWLDLFDRYQLSDTQIGVVRHNNKVIDVRGSGQPLMYLKVARVEVEILDTQTAFELTAQQYDALKTADVGVRTYAIDEIEVPEYHLGMLFIDGTLNRILKAGKYAFWKFGRTYRLKLSDQRLQTLEVSGQEILTRDKVALRLNLMAGYRVTDVLLATSRFSDIEQYLYRELQLGLRAAVGTRSLDELLEDKGVLDAVVTQHIRSKTQGLGLEMESVGVKDIILPGEMKAILSQVVQAEKSAQANVIRRREETAATRSLLNTAKVMEDNPVALRLKELETLERVTEKIDNISVYGGLEGVLTDLIRIKK
ncbi:slipin family protein [Deinococcus roseus]|uniref:Band 7 domain-containing protein n=1 Tax=Deinococcus roseus TaxID=392414 RepID=A0ABQ2CUY5_9DEIO|nr:slipin family protein [Deinococcus roseus]GGJ22690.1 hypothetical protein GCM10008938_06130 [Deinococcus roseus]